MILAHPLTPIENALEAVLKWLGPDVAGGTVGLPWAWAIVALTVLVRIVLVPLTVRQIHSMQNLQRHMPEMKAIQQRYKQDKKRQQEELMRFYRENKINPAASCLPMLAQLPVFFALFFVLRDFSEDPPRGELHWLGLVDITANTSEGWGLLLIVIYVASQVASTFFMSATMDKTQRTIFLVMPFAFVFFILNFPAGLVLYWVTTNLWTVGQGLITRRLAPKPAEPQKRSSRTPPRGESGDGAKRKEDAPKPGSPAPGPPRRVKRKKKAKR